ncbi:uncharacterized protein LOC18433989 [Amborella trichopoda]|uniref:RNA polymerase sigma-70 domain-containing protein n=1 Tax=Amborella trichopoda TaxID=13333 RepID=W1PCX6_AMBTC|nr:uncharacterized protein LOC18433989 [Amborella trichopoda]ERN05803.1 hypothetical protein AMTR_s00006p00257610 [Amborella trichopoda]|eukprot:XP_011623253.2 uncharacterized protein LOC18433989 [Amborella trichopoda]
MAIVAQSPILSANHLHVLAPKNERKHLGSFSGLHCASRDENLCLLLRYTLSSKGSFGWRFFGKICAGYSGDFFELDNGKGHYNESNQSAPNQDTIQRQYVSNGDEMELNVRIRSKKLLERKHNREKKKRKTNGHVQVLEEPQSHKRIVDNRSPSKQKVFRYFRDSAQVRPMSSIEEAKLSLAVKVTLMLEKTKKTLQEEFGRDPTMNELTRATGIDEKELKSRLIEGSRSRERLLSNNIGLVISIAFEYRGRGMALEDLIQAGIISLMRGVEKFDHTKGCKFSTYAYWWIKHGITKAIIRHSRLIRLPHHIHGLLSRVQRARKLIRQDPKMNQNPEEATWLAGLTPAKMSLLMLAAREPISLDRPIQKGSYLNHGDSVVDDRNDSEAKIIMKKHLRQELEKLLEIVSDNERDILIYRCGLERGRGMTLAEIGEIFKVTKQRIGQIEKGALSKLKQPEICERLKHYFYSDADSFL